jgi:anti-sigma B factor antagonist
MAITERHIDGVTILDLSGDLNETSGAEMWRRVRGLAAAGDTRVLLNLAGVSYIDKSGLGTMVASFLAMRRVGGMLKLLGPTQRTQQMLTITALATVVPSFDNEALAVASFGRHAF